MNALSALSYVLNIVFIIVALLVYLKVPEFLQSKILKRMEHDFTERMHNVQFEQQKKINEMNEQFNRKMLSLEHDFTVKLDTLKKHYEVLPVLYEKVAIAHSFYTSNYTGEKLNFKELNHYADLKNFITLNRFFIEKTIFETAKRIEGLIINLATTKHELFVRDAKSDLGGLLSEQKKVEDHLEKSILELEEMIDKKING